MRLLSIQNLIITWLSIIAIMFFFSCAKPVDDNELWRKSRYNRDEFYETTMKACSCLNGNKDDFKFELTIDGKKLCFDKQRQPESVYAIWVQGVTNAIYMDKLNEDSTLRIEMQYHNPAFLKHGIPYLLNNITADSCEAFGIHIINLYPYKSCTCPSDDTRYFALSTVTKRILTFSDNIIEGTFEGDFSNNGGRIFKVTNGYFKTRLKIAR